MTAAFLLFPTITHIVRTPNGYRLSVRLDNVYENGERITVNSQWLFNGFMPNVLSQISRIFRIVPRSLLCLLFRDWPQDQIDVLWLFLNCPPTILASLTMAHQEMNTIKDLDIDLFDKVKHKLYLFFAERDDWVGDNRETVLREMSDEPHSVRVVRGRHDIPHAYCISMPFLFSKGAFADRPL